MSPVYRIDELDEILKLKALMCAQREACFGSRLPPSRRPGRTRSAPFAPAEGPSNQAEPPRVVIRLRVDEATGEILGD